MSELYECPTCHHTSTAYWHPLTPGIVKALVKFKRATIEARTYELHNRKDLDGTPFELTKNEYGNWTMLRYHGLVAKSDRGRGYWVLTKRGNDFLHGRLSVPQRVKTLNNHVIDHDNVYVDINDVMGTQPYFPDIDTLERERQPIETEQASLL